MVRRVGSLLTALLLAAPALAADQAPVPPQAPTLACRCAAGGVCTCDVCDCPGGRPARKAMAFDDAYDLSVVTGRPVIVWLGVACPKCEAQMTDCLHVHRKELGGTTGPAVVVAVPRDGKLYRRGVLPGLPTVDEIRSTILTRSQAPAHHPSQPYQQPAQSWVPSPVALPPQPMPWNGGYNYGAMAPGMGGFGGPFAYGGGGYFPGMGGFASCGPRG